MVYIPLLNSTVAFRSKVYIVLFSFFDFVFVDEGNKRGATWKMLKNQGLKAHKKRVDRNPRVKKRKQYMKKRKRIVKVYSIVFVLCFCFWVLFLFWV